MAKPPFLMGQARGVESSSRPSRQDQQKAVDDGIQVVVQAIKELMQKPQSEREAHIGDLGMQLEVLAGRVGRVDDGSRTQRLAATKKIIGILQQASDAKS